MKKVLTCLLAVALSIALSGATAHGEPKESPPSDPVVIKTSIGFGWELTIVADAKTNSSRVGYSSSGFLESTRASISVKDCARLAEAIEDAAKAVKNDKRYESDKVGDVTVSVGEIEVIGKDKQKEKKKVVQLGGGETGLFSKPLAMNLSVEEAGKFAASLRRVPGVHARLKAAIDFDAMWKEK